MEVFMQANLFDPISYCHGLNVKLLDSPHDRHTEISALLEQDPVTLGIKTLIWGPEEKYVKVVHGEQIKYIAIEELSKHLGLTQKVIKKFSALNDNANELLEHHALLCREYSPDLKKRVLFLANKSGNSDLIKSVLNISKFVGEANVLEALKSPEFEAGKMQNTIIKISQTLQERVGNAFIYSKKGKEHYGFVISSENHILIKSKLLAHGGAKKIFSTTSLNPDKQQEFVVGTVNDYKWYRQEGNQPEIADGHEGQLTELEHEEQIKNEIGNSSGILPKSKVTEKNIPKAHPKTKHKSNDNTGVTYLKSASKSILIEEKMVGDGELLVDKPGMTQLKAMLGAAEGLKAMHEKGLVHSDNKLGNILIDKHGNGKLTDFGFSGHKGQPIRGSSPIYSAPEYDTQTELDPSQDSYSLGVELLQLSNPELFAFGLIKSSLYKLARKHLITVARKIFENEADTIITTKNYKLCLCYLDQNELQELLQTAEESIKDTIESEGNSLDQQAKLAMLHTARKLLCIEAKQRLTCAEAHQELTTAWNSLMRRQPGGQ